MHLRDLVMQRWAEAGLYERKDAHLKSFLKHVSDTPMECWTDYVALFRRDYYDLFDTLIPPLAAANDKLLRIALIRQVDFNQLKELGAVRAFVRSADPVGDRPELNAILNRSGNLLKKDFMARDKLREIIEPKPVAVRKTTNTVHRKKAARRKK